MSLEDLRGQIDGLDQQIVALLTQRAELSYLVGQEKAALGAPVYNPQREAALLDVLTSGDLGRLERRALEAIYREILSASRALQHQLQVAYLGPEYTFSHLAAVTHFGSSCALLPRPTIDEVFGAVERGNADFGVTPIENTIQGVETRTLDSFIESPLLICGELFVDVHICLAASGELRQIERVHSHPQPLAQCHRWLKANLPQAETVTAASTAAAAAAVAAANDPSQAALATAAAAEHHGLRVLAESVEDQPHNRTRFFVIGHAAPGRTGSDRTSLLFTTRHQSGALYSALAPFSAHQISLSLIQSRPAPARLEGPYVFYADLEGHQEDLAVRQCLRELRDLTQTLKVLGSYPQGRQ
jgi:chorismate mutase / prephenate dehydratase